MSFSRFGSLPPELREQIWMLCLPADEPEVCLMWPVYLHSKYEGPEGLPEASLPSRPFVVDTAFPALMHVCRESRSTVQNSQRSGVRFRNSSAAGCLVPFRHYRPDLDTVYWGSENVEELSRKAASLPELGQITSLALELQWGFRHDYSLIAALLGVMKGLKTLSIVLPSSSDDNWPRQVGEGHEAFKQPGRRCKLRTVDANEKPMIHVDTTGDDWAMPAELVPLPVALRQCRESLERSARRTRQDSFRSAQLPGDSRCDQIWLDNLAIRAQTFEEYQKDGTWKEICGERRFIDNGRERFMMGRYMPLAERPDPELVRVNDLDAEFAQIYVGHL
jgi:hypothetical protein